MTSNDFRQQFSSWINPDKIFLGGANYADTTLAFLLGPLWDAFYADNFNTNTSVWTPGWECRDFARDFCNMAQKANAKSPNRPNGIDILAVGFVWFIPDRSRYASSATSTDGRLAGPPPAVPGGHSIVMAWVETLGWVFFDPQVKPTTRDASDPAVWQMTEAEVKSIYLCLF